MAGRNAGPTVGSGSKALKTIIHVNRAIIARNTRDGGDRPVYTIKRDGRVRYAREVTIMGPSRLVYGGRLPCGARAWIETESELKLVGECSYREAFYGE